MVVPDEKGAKGNYALKGSFAPISDVHAPAAVA